MTPEDREALKAAPRSGNSPNPTGIAGAVMSDESYVNRGVNPGLNPAMNNSGILGQTVNPNEIEATQSSELGDETEVSGSV